MAVVFESGDVGGLAEIVSTVRNAQGIDPVEQGDWLDVNGWGCWMDSEIFESDGLRGGERDEMAFVPGFVGTVGYY